MDIKTSSRCWGYSRRPKNWRKFMEFPKVTSKAEFTKVTSKAEDEDGEDGYNLFDLIARQSPMKSRMLTPAEVREFGLPAEFPDREPIKPKPAPAPKPRRPPQPMEDPSSSYL